MDLRKSSITANILNALSDGKLHKIDEIAEIVEVSRSTVKRHIQSLSYRYPIETIVGGRETGGVILDKKYLHQGKIRSRDELQIISQALELLQKSGSEVDQELLGSLIQEFTIPTNNKTGEQKWGEW